MNTQIIERIKGYCTEVNQSQWEELVRVAHAIGVNPSEYDVWDVSYPVFCVDVVEKTVNGYADIELAERNGLSVIPFPDFLAKLRGEEWTPKAGEMVEVSRNGEVWIPREFVTKSKGRFIVWSNADEAVDFPLCRPLLSTITRAEAEQQLGKRIID